jgi:ParB/RepB/Spo0J family partition protein
MLDLALDDVKFNKHTSRLTYSQASIDRMAKSMFLHGQLSPVKVRPCERTGKYELVFGHRRVLAARNLGWKTIRGEVIDATDDQVIQQGLVENIEREGISDFEKAVIFQKLNLEFNKTYEQIGQIVGLSKQSISNYIAMLSLFDPYLLRNDPRLLEMMRTITERHARVLQRVHDQKTREDLLRMTVMEDVSARHLANIVSRLRGWFHECDLKASAENATFGKKEKKFAMEASRRIRLLLNNTFLFARAGDRFSFDRLYLFGEGYSVFPGISVEKELLEGEKAVSYNHSWLDDAGPKMMWKIEEAKIKILSRTSALATLGLVYSDNAHRDFRCRGTVILVWKKGDWRIVHEHWSELETNRTSSQQLIST